MDTPRDQLVAQIREKAAMLEVVQDYVALRRSGKNYAGLCPFHSERTPSFTVSEEKQLFHCFGCGEGGDVFAFVMKMEQLDFSETLKWLADRLGVPYLLSGEGKQEKRALSPERSVLAHATCYFVDQLMGESGKLARRFLADRAITPPSVAQFKLGYGGDEATGLEHYLLGKGFSHALIDQSGLLGRFVGRLVFPIRNSRGEVVGFGSRMLEQGGEVGVPKYLNSNENVLFKKRELLYGLDMASRSIRKAGHAVVVEGYFDVISSVQAGVTNVVAPLGTALTEEQVKLLRHYTQAVTLAYDGDEAGRKATAHSIQLFRAHDFHVQVCVLPLSQDPDSLIQGGQAAQFVERLAKSFSWFHFLAWQASEGQDLAYPEAKAKWVRQFLPMLASVSSQIEQAEYLKILAQIADIDKGLLQAEFRRFKLYGAGQRNGTNVGKNKRPFDRPVSREARAEKELVRLCIEVPEVFALLKGKLKADDFRDENYRQLVSEWLTSGVVATPHEIMNREPSFRELVLAEVPDGDNYQIAQDCLKVIQVSRLREEMKEIRGKLENAEQAGETDQVMVLHQAFSRRFGEVLALTRTS